jgi:hypothetical protein
MLRMTARERTTRTVSEMNPETKYAAPVVRDWQGDGGSGESD